MWSVVPIIFIINEHKKNKDLVGAFDADKCLSKGHGPEATVKEEQANVGVDMEEGGHVQVVGQSGWKSQDSDHALCGLHLRRQKPEPGQDEIFHNKAC